MSGMKTSREFLMLMLSNTASKLKFSKMTEDECDKELLNTKFQQLPGFKLTRELIAHWWCNLYKGEARLKDGIYNGWSRAAQHRFFDYIKPSGCSFLDGTGPALSISLEKNANIEAAIEEFEFWRPYMKARKEKELGISGYFLSIFEYTLNEHGCFYLWIGDKVWLTSSVYHCPDILKKFHTLRDALTYVREHHYAPTY